MRMVTGYFRPTSGKVAIGGVDMLEEPERAKKSIGYLPENAPLYSDMTVLSFLSFCAEIRGLSGAARTRALDRVLEMCFLHNVRHQSVDTLSKGYRHRTCFAQSIIHDPDVLILDEPTDGLDPNQKHEVRGMIKRMGENKAIIFSTHILEEVEAACTRAIIIDRGRVVADGSPDQLKQQAPGANSLRVGVAGAGAAEELAKVPGVQSVEPLASSGAIYRGLLHPVRGKRAADLALEVSALAAARNWKLEELSPMEGKLDEVFRSITQSDTAK
jgi:ABC-2 type transport system ATP-binding protein